MPGAETLPVIHRRFSKGIFKQAVEVAAIGKTKFFDDRGNTFIRVGEKLAGFLKVDGLSVFEDRLSGLFFYDPI